MRGWTKWAALCGAAVLLPLSVARAGEECPQPPPLPPSAGPLYLILSVEDEFDLQLDGEFAFGTDCIVVNLGHVLGGADALDARAVIDAVAPFAIGDLTLGDLEGNEVTVVGSYTVPSSEPEAPPDPHVVNPIPGDPIDFAVQAAIFDATHDGAVDALGPFTNTLDVVFAIASRADVGAQDVYDAIFTTDQVLSLANGIVSTEGELFPHDPKVVEPLFHFSFDLEEDEDGEIVVTGDVCRVVDADVKPNASPNLLKISTKKGALKVALLSDERFDAAEVDPATAHVDGVPALSSQMQDVDHDGDDDIVFKFKVKALVEAGVVDDCTTEIAVRADLEDGTCVVGTDAVEPSDDCAEESD
jgi:hypothetical protein